MKTEIKPKLQRTLKLVVNMLVEKKYSELERYSRGTRLRAVHIQAGIEEYGRTLRIPPNDAYEEIDVIEVKGRTPPTYSVRFRLFTEEEGRSDLELQATLIDDDVSSEFMRVEIDGLLVA